MKRFLMALALAAGVAMGTHSAWAFSIQADVPVAYSLTQTVTGVHTGKATESSGSTSGGIVGVNFGWLGLQYEDYTISQKMPSNFTAGHENLAVTMYDLVLSLPFPFIHISVGGGVGSGHLSGSGFSTTTSNKDADLTGYFAQVGIPIGPLSDIHVSYREVSGTNKLADTSGAFNVKQDAQVYTIGLLLGW
jgi:hypothetical protein